MFQLDKKNASPQVKNRVRTRTISSFSTIGHDRSRTSSLSSFDVHIPYKQNNSNNNDHNISRNSSFLSFNLFAKSSAGKENIPRIVPETTATNLVSKVNIIEKTNCYESLPNVTQIKHNSGKKFDLPLLLTFTDQGRCYIDTNSDNSSLLSNIDEQLQMGKNLKTMVQFIYGNLNTQLDFKPLNLNLPETFDEANLIKQSTDNNGFYSIRLTPYFQSQSNAKAINFHPLIRRVGPNSQIIICRNSKHIQKSIRDIPEIYQPVFFTSNVISRIHGYLKVDSSGNWFIQDVKSASGTFLNHNRISPNSKISKDIYIKDGDIIQLGLTINNNNDNGDEDIVFRCVRMKVEVNDSWKLNKEKLKITAKTRLKNLIDTENHETCAVCLYECKPYQPLFFAPCAHCWHYNCIKVLLNKYYPNFTCPNCRATFDMEEEYSDEESDLELENAKLNIENSILENSIEENEDREKMEQSSNDSDFTMNNISLRTIL